MTMCLLSLRRLIKTVIWKLPIVQLVLKFFKLIGAIWTVWTITCIGDNVIGKNVSKVLAFSFGWEVEYLEGGGRGMEAMVL